MSKKLAELIAGIVIAAGDDDGCSSIPAELVAAAVRVVPSLTEEDLAKLPEMWYPSFSAKKAGAPKLNEGWGRMWFEAVVEILYQAGPAGLPALFELLNRDLKTYHGMVVVRLLRFAVNGVKKKEIVDRVKARLPEIPARGGIESVEETMLWASRGDLRLGKLIKSMAKIEVKGIGKETVGSVMREWAESRSVQL